MLLYLGPQAGARALALQIKSPPIEVVLAEAAVALIQRCRPPGSPQPHAPGSSDSLEHGGPGGAEAGPGSPNPEPGGAEAGPPVSDVVPGAVLSFLRRRVRIMLPLLLPAYLPLEVFDAWTAEL